MPFGAAAEGIGLGTTEIDLAHQQLQSYLRSVVDG